MGTDPGRTVGVRGSTVSGFGSRVSGSTQDSPQQRSELWLILNMSHARSVTRNLWPGRNFFVCRKLTVIVLTAAMNFLPASPPAMQDYRRSNVPADLRHDTENMLSVGLCVSSTAGRNLRFLTCVRNDNPVFGHCDSVAYEKGD